MDEAPRHKIKKVKEPYIPWKRHDFGDNPAPTDKPRQRGEYETDRDLTKPIQQLLSDVEETHRKWADKYPSKGRATSDTSPADDDSSEKKWTLAVELILEALARATAMNARVAQTNTSLSRTLIVLTFILVFLTGALVWLT